MVRSQQAASQCVFCGKRGSSREHVFADWIGGFFGPGRRLVHSGTGRRAKIAARPALFTRAVCVTCNNEWMGDIENCAKPILEQVLRGRTVSWGPSEQVAVATWAFKTALMIDRSRVSDHYVAGLEHVAFLYEYQLPPGSALVSLARYFPSDLDPPDMVNLISSGTDKHEVVGYPGGLVWRIGFNVGQVVFYVQGFPGIDDVGLRPVPFGTLGNSSGLYLPIGDSFSELWPRGSDSFTWPPAGEVLDTRALRSILA